MPPDPSFSKLFLGLLLWQLHFQNLLKWKVFEVGFPTSISNGIVVRGLWVSFVTAPGSEGTLQHVIGGGRGHGSSSCAFSARSACEPAVCPWAQSVKASNRCPLTQNPAQFPAPPSGSQPPVTPVWVQHSRLAPQSTCTRPPTHTWTYRLKEVIGFARNLCPHP